MWESEVGGARIELGCWWRQCLCSSKSVFVLGCGSYTSESGARGGRGAFVGERRWGSKGVRDHRGILVAECSCRIVSVLGCDALARS